MGDFQDSYRISAPAYDKQIKKPQLGDERGLWVQVHALKKDIINIDQVMPRARQNDKPSLYNERGLWVQVHAPAGWGRRIRTFGMTESESVALPLGDTPIFD